MPSDWSEHPLIKRLLAADELPELNDKELALLEACLRQPLKLSRIQREKRQSGRSEYQETCNRLKLILDYNRNLRATDSKKRTDAGSNGPQTGQRVKEPRPERAEYNVKAREYLKEHPLAKARDLAAAIGCGLGTVPKLPAWQAVLGERRKGRVPKCVTLTDKLEATVGEEDAELQRLMKEQETDRRETGHGYEDDEEAPRHKFSPRKKP
jgi:hypothetical protein